MAGTSTVTQRPLRQKLKLGYSDIAQSKNQDYGMFITTMEFDLEVLFSEAICYLRTH